MAILFLSLKRHLEKLLPRLASLRHLSHLKPLAFFIQLDDVSHPSALGNLQSPLQGIGAHLRHRVGLSAFGGERTPTERLCSRIIRDKCQSGMNRRTILFGLSLPLNDQYQA